jgi:hypothetical protein
MKFIRLISVCLAIPAFPRAALALPDLSPSALKVPAAITNEPNPRITISWCVAKDGSNGGSDRYDGLFVSTNPVVGNAGWPFASWYVPMPWASHDLSCATNSFTLPIFVSGDYYLIFKTDFYNWIAESDENNNVIVSPFRFEATPPDQAPLSLEVEETITSPPNPYITVIWAVTNLGPGTAKGGWIDSLYYATNALSTPEATRLGTYYVTGPVAAGEVYWQTNTVRIPITSSGTFYLVFQTDFTNILWETNLSNNSIAAPVKFTIQPPDLAPLALLAPTNVSSLANPTLNIVWGVTNQGSGAAVAPWLDALFLSTNTVLDNGLIAPHFGSRSAALRLRGSSNNHLGLSDRHFDMGSH